MRDIITILIIAVALSMDTFSVSLSLGTGNIPMKKGMFLATTVGIMHFIMPLIGMIAGSFILKILPFEHDFFLGIIFLILAFKMAYDFFIEKEENINLNLIGIFLFSLSVSFDALTTGIGLLIITDKIIIATSIFMIVSYLFTLGGILLGKYVNEKLGTISSIIGIIILTTMALYLII